MGRGPARGGGAVPGARGALVHQGGEHAGPRRQHLHCRGEGSGAGALPELPGPRRGDGCGREPISRSRPSRPPPRRAQAFYNRFNQMLNATRRLVRCSSVPPPPPPAACCAHLHAVVHSTACLPLPRLPLPHRRSGCVNASNEGGGRLCRCCCCLKRLYVCCCKPAAEHTCLLADLCWLGLP